MIRYLIECLVFQLVFLMIYDFFLKKETFFKWNRAYLLGTFVLSLVLPWIKIEALKTTVSSEFIGYPTFLIQLDEVMVSPTDKVGFFENLSTIYLLFGSGALLAALWFGFKLFSLIRLRKQGTVYDCNDFTKVVVQQSEIAFSFFGTIFLGDKISKEKESNIIAHELVHIKQWHSVDLLFFELMRILFWFNPLVYIYQNRVSELHEFIADSKVGKENKKEQYQLLLSEVFQTQNISFVNQFFKKSLIKKRIVMLQKQKSKAIWQLKYTVVLPLVFGIIMFNSCQVEESNAKKTDSLTERISLLEEEITSLDSLTQEEKEALAKMIYNVYPKETKGISGKYGNINYSGVPFASVDEAPIFPGCENAEDTRACFQEMMQKHIRKHFNYPQEAQEKGIQGRVNIIFKISSDGSITELKLRGPDVLLENEARRIISKLPKMVPGKQNGEVVDVPFSIPITFKLK
nr:M56 family metallopeptidase [uncultured Allomuricauda sp.]